MEVGDEVVVGPFWGAQIGEDEASNSSSMTSLTFPEFLLDFASSAPQEIISTDSTELELECFSNIVEEYSTGQPWHLDSTISEEPAIPLQPQPLLPSPIAQSHNYDNDEEQHSSSLDEDMDAFDPSGITSDSSDDEGTPFPPRRRRRAQLQPLKKKGGAKNVTSSRAFIFIANTNERKIRFIRGLQMIFIKMREMENRTGAKGQLKASYESREYTLEDVEEFLNTFKKGNPECAGSSADDIETCRPTSEELEDDHRYAATILTQKVSSTSVHDHQYNEVSTSSGISKRMRKVWYEEHGSTEGHRDLGLTRQPQLKCEPFIKIKSERERTLRQFLDTLYSKITRIETRTKAMIELIVAYQSHTFTSQNYAKAGTILKKNRVPRQRIPIVSATVTRIQENVASGTQNTLFVRFQQPSTYLNPSTPHVTFPIKPESHSSSPIPTIDLEPESEPQQSIPSPEVRPIPEPSKVSTTTESVVNTNPGVFVVDVICRKCLSSAPPHHDGRQVTWIRCADALCQYMIHSACTGFYVHHPRDLRRLPPFYCETHRDWDE